MSKSCHSQYIYFRENSTLKMVTLYTIYKLKNNQPVGHGVQAEQELDGDQAEHRAGQDDDDQAGGGDGHNMLYY